MLYSMEGGTTLHSVITAGRSHINPALAQSIGFVDTGHICLLCLIVFADVGIMLLPYKGCIPTCT